MAFPFKCSLHFVTDSHKLQMMINPQEFGMAVSVR